MRNSKICECCLDFTSLLQSYDGKLVLPTKLSDITISREEIETIIIYMSSWTQRQCSCCFRDSKNFERFNWAIQVLIVVCVKILPYYCKDGNSKERTSLPSESIEEGPGSSTLTEESKNLKKEPDGSGSAESSTVSTDTTVTTTVHKENWDIDDKEKLIQFVTKVFMITFPTYMAFKQYIQLKPDDITQQEIQVITHYCELNDTHESCIFLLRNVVLFCRLEGMEVLANCFHPTAFEYLSIHSASIVVNLASNLKIWLNYQTLLNDYVPFRSNVLSYMCKMLDTELKTSADRSLSEYIWNALKDPMDIHIVAFDKDGLDLAHKYFLSTNLVMRLSGINQINNHINLFNDLLNSENLIDSEQIDQQLTTWLLENKMVEHIYGPNNHVEVIKQSLTILTFLAMEGKITNEHIDIIWSAAQLKHCAKQVYDILSALICNLGSGPANHLHTLLSTLEPKEHTENSLCLASHLIKYIWTNSISSYISLHQQQQQLNAKLMGKISKSKNILHNSSSENNSVSGDESDDSEDDEDEENSVPTNHKTSLHERLKKANRGLKISQLTRLLKPSPTHSGLDSQENTSSEEEDEDDEDESHSDVESDIINESSSSKVLLSSKCQSQSDSDADGERSEHSENERSVPNKDKRKILRRKKDGQVQVKLKEKNLLPVKGVEIKIDEIDSSCNISSSSKMNISGISGISVNDDEKENDQKSSSSANVPTTILTPGAVDDKNSKVIVDSISMKTSTNNNVGKIAKSVRKKIGKVSEENTVINELSNFVKDSSFIQENLTSTNNSDPDDSDGSYSSRISTKSEKNMADFDGEDDILLSQSQTLELSSNKNQNARFNLDLFRRPVKRVNQKSFINTRQGFNFSLDNVCLPGQTLLWDLIQDENIVQLSEGLSSEALKILTSLLCFDADKRIKLKFIEGCIENFANNRSIVVSLRLLAKLLTSFQLLRNPEEIHTITTWAEEKLDLLAKFFANFNKIHEITESTSPFPYITHVQARLQFLSVIFSTMGSPATFKLSLKHVDALWDNLVVDSRSCDELFNWLNENVRLKDLHALSNEALHHIFVRKIPSLPPESITMNALTLFQQLLNIARICQTEDISDINAISDSMDYVWKIALCAENTDVSMNAINFLNVYYIGKQLENEEEFVRRCMSHLSETSKDLPSTISTNEDHLISKIQRALLLLKTHLEIFRKRYAYHLRKWALDGQGVDSHAQFIGDKGSVPLRIIIQPAGYHEKVAVEMLSTDYVGALRAEIAKWTETIQEYLINERLSTTGPSIINDGPIRIITQGTELSAECDEKTLSEVPIKDSQIVYVSIGAPRTHKKKDSSEYSSSLPPPPRDKLPLTLLLKPEYFEQLFSLMQTLSTIQVYDSNGKCLQHTKAQVLSRRIWDILMLLPTNTSIKEGFTKISESNNSFKSLLDPSSPQKLMYSLYIVEAFIKPANLLKPKAKDSYESRFKKEKDAKKELLWREKFIQAGALSHLFDIFLSASLEPSSGLNRQDIWNEWKQDCLACLLKIMSQLGVRNDDLSNISEQFYENESPKKSHHTSKPKKRKIDDEKFTTIPRLNESMLLLMENEGVMERLNSIFKACSEPRDPKEYKTGNYGRAQLLHYAMALLIYWAFNCVGVRSHLYSQPEFPIWLKRLVLEDPEPNVRRELCTGIYKLCLGTGASSNPPNPNPVKPISSTPVLIAHLLKYLNNSLAIKPVQKFELQSQNYDCEGKEPYGPACRDYFWLLSRLLESLDQDFVKESIENPENCSLDLDGLTKNLSESIIKREYLETRQNLIKDDALIGLLTTNTVVMKYNTPFKTSKEGQIFLKQTFDCLFSLPTSQCRYLPKCKSLQSRAAAFDLLTEMAKNSVENYYLLQNLLMEQHQPKSHVPYPWDYWPWEDGRSSCGYVGLTNLGATCYMNSCMQLLYMMPQIRAEILKAQISPESKHVSTLKELQRMFAYLQESERKSYNPRSFCKVYQMDHQPLNTGEQKDMAEFFIDLVSKLEEMTPELKKLVKKLFSGVLTNNVVSLGCGHVSRTLEEFYTVRCGVADMRNLYESLDEVTVKDTLEGDNMYTCSNCGKKVRAEKRACFKKLPKILCFNTMRYTFNMITMMKEKVNSHFSFPQTLNMSGYVEKTLMPQQYQEDKKKHINSTSTSLSSTTTRSNEELEQNEDEEKYTPSSESDDDSNLMYELIGVTVHTGTADGGHYYSFIRDRTCQKGDKWYLFNDSEVKPFDPNELPNECFGGNMNTKTYDTNLNKFMDFSFEKTNSAYMLFYIQSDQINNERCSNNKLSHTTTTTTSSPAGLYGENSLIPSLPGGSHQTYIPSFSLNDELEDWIWTDNTQFLRDKNIFEHAYFSFMWQLCGHIPGTLLAQEDVYLLATKLSTHFFLETYIHSKEKFEMVQWVELLTKQLQTSHTAAVWLLDHMTDTEWWPIQILIKCPNQMVRQMFQRLCIHVIQQLRAKHLPLYLKLHDDALSDHPNSINLEEYGSYSCVTRFVKQHLSLLENVAKSHLKHLTEFFTFLHDFSKMGEEECVFLINVQAISKIVNFYLGSKKDEVEHGSEEDDDDIISMPEKNKVASLEKGITLIANLVEKSRDNTNSLRLSSNDWTAMTGKNFHFILQQIRDGINYASTRNLIFSLCRWNDQLAVQIINAIFDVIHKHPETSHPFYKVLNLLAEHVGGPGHPSISEPILARILDVAESVPYPTLEWLSLQVPRNKIVNKWCLSTMDTWVEHFLISHTHQRVRNAAASLLVSLVPNPIFRQGYRNANNKIYGAGKEVIILSPDAQCILTEIYVRLLNLLKPAKHYVDAQIHGTCKLTAYFAVLTYFTISKNEKMMFCQYFMDLWNLFHPKLSEPCISIHQNKQGLLNFWNHVCEDSPDNIQRIVHNQAISKNIGFNYILADHDDQEVVMYNRAMLPAYYGIIRKCCQSSRAFASHLARHQNINWAFKNIAHYQNLYPKACEELFKIMQIYVSKVPETTSEETEMAVFKRTTIQSFFQVIDGRSNWNTFINIYRILVSTFEDRYFVLVHDGLNFAFEAIYSLHTIHHEATSCNVSGDIADILAIVDDLLKVIRLQFSNPEESPHITKYISNSKDWPDVLRHIATFLNTYNSHEIRNTAIQCLTDLIYIMPGDCIRTLVPLIYHCHSTCHESQGSIIGLGPFFPKRSQPPQIRSQIRPSRPMLQMSIPLKARDNLKGDEEFERQLSDFYNSYHQYIDIICRVSIMRECFSQELVTLSAMLGFEAAPLRFIFYPKLWLEIYNTQNVDRKYISMLVSSPYFRDYVEYTLKDDRASLTNTIIYNFLVAYIGKIFDILIIDDGLLKVLVCIAKDFEKIVEKQPKEIGPMIFIKLLGDLKALTLFYCPTLGRSHSGPFRAPAPCNSHFKSIINSLKSYIEGLLEQLMDPPLVPPESPTEEPTKKRKIDKNSSADEQAGPSTRQQPKSDENPDEVSTQELYLLNKSLSTKDITKDWLGLILSTIDVLLKNFGPCSPPAANGGLQAGEKGQENVQSAVAAAGHEKLQDISKENSENVSPVSSSRSTNSIRGSLPATNPHISNTQSSPTSSTATIVMDVDENLENLENGEKLTITDESKEKEVDAAPAGGKEADADDKKK